MKTRLTHKILAIVFLLLAKIVVAQPSGGGWTELPDSNFINFTPSSNSYTIICDANNQLYRNGNTMCFGVQAAKYKNSAWRTANISGCDNTFLETFQKDDAGNVYILLKKDLSPYYIQGYLYKLIGDSVQLCDTNIAASNSYNWQQKFSISKSGNVYSVRNTGSNFGVYQYNAATKNWNILKGTGNDTIPVTSTIFQLNTDKTNFPIVGFNIGATYKYMRWSGSKWLDLGINAAYCNTTNLVLGIVKDFSGNLYGYGTMATNATQQFRAKWNETNNIWDLLPYTLNNLYADTCIKINSINFFAENIAYAISSCTNSSNREFVAKWNGTNWQQLGNLANNNSINAIAIDNAANVYAVGAFTNATGYYYTAKYVAIVPTVIQQFLATKKNNMVECYWKIQLQNTISQFNLQRSEDGITFKNIATIQATNASNFYYDDIKNVAINTANVFYRLQIINNDASLQYSNIIPIKLTGSAINIYPNPAKNSTNIFCSNGKLLIVYNAFGQKIHEQKITNNFIAYNTSLLQQGVYNVKIITNTGEILTEKLVVQ